MVLKKLPDNLKRNLQTELSHKQPSIHLTIEQLNKAFDIVTNRLDKKDDGKVVTSYNNFDENETDTCDSDFHEEE